LRLGQKALLERARATSESADQRKEIVDDFTGHLESLWRSSAMRSTP
jgi:hypothetical protein